MFNALYAVPSAAELIEWLHKPVPEPLSLDEAHTSFLLAHPRMVYLKNLPRDCTVFDIGAGTGALRGLRMWPGIQRPDIGFVGTSLEHGEFTPDYEEFHLGDIELNKPSFSRPFQHAIASQFIEHMREPVAFLTWLAAAMPAGGTLYLDWPSLHSMSLPSLTVLRDAGFNAMTLNFLDDGTHTRTFGIDEMAAMLATAGFRLRSAGEVDMPFLADSLKHWGIANQDSYMLTMALWLRTRFVSYISAVRL